MPLHPDSGAPDPRSEAILNRAPLTRTCVESFKFPQISQYVKELMIQRAPIEESIRREVGENTLEATTLGFFLLLSTTTSIDRNAQSYFGMYTDVIDSLICMGYEIGNREDAGHIWKARLSRPVTSLIPGGRNKSDDEVKRGLAIYEAIFMTGVLWKFGFGESAAMEEGSSPKDPYAIFREVVNNLDSGEETS